MSWLRLEQLNIKGRIARQKAYWHDTTRHDRSVHNGHGRIVLVLASGTVGGEGLVVTVRIVSSRRVVKVPMAVDFAAAMMSGPGEKVDLVGWSCLGRPG